MVGFSRAPISQTVEIEKQSNNKTECSKFAMLKNIYVTI